VLFPEVTPNPNAIKELQHALEVAFPAFNEQSTKSADGFKAHLTLGQFSSLQQLQKFQAELAKVIN